MLLLILSSLGGLGLHAAAPMGSVRDPGCAPFMSAAGVPLNRPPRRTTTPQLSPRLWHLRCLVSTTADCGAHHLDRCRHARPDLERRRTLGDQHVEPVEHTCAPLAGRTCGG